tara:strand:- start:1220 stop:2152 length:933 start_codon:yes stop_codon:yes gene_type:complete
MILVTGGTGFLGSHIVGNLNLNKYKVIYTSSKTISEVSYNHSLQSINIDFSHSFSEKEFPNNIETIIHTAGLSQKDCFSNLDLAKKVNIDNSIKLAKIAIKKSVKRFFFLSSVHVYGSNLIGEVGEKFKTKPYDNYSKTKLDAENELINIFQKSDIDLTILRLSNVFGAPTNIHSNIWHLIGPHLCMQAVKKKEMKLESNGLQTRDFIGIKDFLKIIIKLVNYDIVPSCKIYNCGSGKPILIRELAERIKNRCEDLFNTDVDLILGTNDTDKSNYIFNSNQLFSKINFIPSENLNYEIDEFLKFCANINN